MTTPNSIYGLTGSWLDLMAALEDTFDEATGEYHEPEGTDAAFEALGEDIEAKLCGCAHVLRRLKADAALVGDEVSRLQARRKRIDASRVRLEERVRLLMVQTETPRAKNPSITITLSKAAQVVSITGPVPPQYCTTPVLPEARPMKAEIKAAIKAGVAVPGAELVDGSRSLRIT
jgi:hypothetical protein